MSPSADNDGRTYGCSGCGNLVMVKGGWCGGCDCPTCGAPPSVTPEDLDDAVCDLVMAAQQGRYDGLDADRHLERVRRMLASRVFSSAEAVCGHPSGEFMFGRCSACGARVTASDKPPDG